jgi:hypothetical protein
MSGPRHDSLGPLTLALLTRKPTYSVKYSPDRSRMRDQTLRLKYPDGNIQHRLSAAPRRLADSLRRPKITKTDAGLFPRLLIASLTQETVIIPLNSFCRERFV